MSFDVEKQSKAVEIKLQICKDNNGNFGVFAFATSPSFEGEWASYAKDKPVKEGIIYTITELLDIPDIIGALNAPRNP